MKIKIVLMLLIMKKL